MQVKWDKVSVRTTDGLSAGIAPVIISASRATDIPAFYGEWFAGRLASGYVSWTNPFNLRQKQIVSFAKTRVVVFWSKNPAPIERYLDQLDERGINYYFTYTVNDYEQEGLEKSVPPLDERLATFRRLAEHLGSERVVWRFDPIIVGGSLTPERILEKIARIGDQLQRHTRKLVISFADISRYRNVRENLKRSGLSACEEPGPDAVQQIAHGIQTLNKNWGLRVASCAEKADLSAFDIAHNRCIDDDLMARVFPHDARLMAFLGRGSAPLPGDAVDTAAYFPHRAGSARNPGTNPLVPPFEKGERGGGDILAEHADGAEKKYNVIHGMTRNQKDRSIPRIPDGDLGSDGKDRGSVDAANPLKDRSQRQACGCIASKDIGRYNTCPHHCVYCYANSSFEQADEAFRTHSPGNERI